MSENEMIEWVDETLKGNPGAFEALYNSTNQRVWFLCLNYLKNEQDALDIMQDTYLTAYKNLKDLQNPKSFPGWLLKIASNKCINYFKSNRPVPVEDETLEKLMAEDNELFLSEKYVIDKEHRQIVMNIMKKSLSDVQYQTVLMYYFNNMTIPEIAAVMECPEGTVKYRLSIARGKIKSGVEQYEKKHDTKLYSFAGVPILALILAEEAKGCYAPQAAAGIVSAIYEAAGVEKSTGVQHMDSVSGTVVEDTIANVADDGIRDAGKKISKMAAKGFLSGTKAKLAVGAAVVVLGAGVVAVVQINNRSAGDETAISKDTDDSRREQDSDEKYASLEDNNQSSGGEGVIKKDNKAAYTEDMRGYIDDNGNYVNDYFGFTTYYGGQGWDLQLYEDYYYNSFGAEKTFVEAMEEHYAPQALWAQHWEDGAMDRGQIDYDCYDLLHNMEEVEATTEWYDGYMLDQLSKFREANPDYKYSLYSALIDGTPCYYIEKENHTEPSPGEILYGAPHHDAIIYVFKDNMNMEIVVYASYCPYNYEEVFSNQLKLLNMSDFVPMDIDDIEKQNEADRM